VRRAPGMSTEWLYRWKKAHTFHKVLIHYAGHPDASPDDTYDRVTEVLPYARRWDKWAQDWVRLPDTADGLDILLGRFFNEYALNHATTGDGLDVANFINMALFTIENLTDDIAENLLEEGVRKDDIERLETDAGKKVVMAFRAECPEAFRA